jgi:hypothetical protein
MSQWGVFREETGEVHIAPVLPDGRLTLRHSLHEFCQCGPKPEELEKLVMWVHQDPESGGCNS